MSGSMELIFGVGGRGVANGFDQPTLVEALDPFEPGGLARLEPRHSFVADDVLPGSQLHTDELAGRNGLHLAATGT